jgi:hypothetical protein
MPCCRDGDAHNKEPLHLESVWVGDSLGEKNNTVKRPIGHIMQCPSNHSMRTIAVRRMFVVCAPTPVGFAGPKKKRTRPRLFCSISPPRSRVNTSENRTPRRCGRLSVVCYRTHTHTVAAQQQQYTCAEKRTPSDGVYKTRYDTIYSLNRYTQHHQDGSFSSSKRRCTRTQR